jgi:GNAT superfamily N-acetyltransferase
MADSLIATIEPLNQSHDRAAFSCGNDALDTYLKTRARQDQVRQVAQVYVAITPAPERIAAYYTISTYGIVVGELPENVARRLPKYPVIPAALIGRLAVANDLQGQGFGKMLLIDAFRRSLAISKQLAVQSIVVHAKDENAAAYYRKFGFIPFPSAPLKLFIQMLTVKQLGLPE